MIVVICFSGHAAYGHALKLGGRNDKHFVEGKIDQSINHLFTQVMSELTDARSKYARASTR